MGYFMAILKAFVVGGLICFIGQVLLNKTSLPPAKILVGFVVTGVFLGAIGIYEPIIKFAGCGASVPLTGFGYLLTKLTGFGYLLTKGVKEAVSKEGMIGILKGGLSSCSIGVSAAIFMGLFVAIFFNSKRK